VILYHPHPSGPQAMFTGDWSGATFPRKMTPLLAAVRKRRNRVRAERGLIILIPLLTQTRSRRRSRLLLSHRTKLRSSWRYDLGGRLEILCTFKVHGAMAERKIKLAHESARSEGEQLLTQSGDLVLDGGRFAGLMMRRAGDFDRTARALLLISAQPLAHGGNGGLEQTSGGLEAAPTAPDASDDCRCRAFHEPR
jgi:hypothetical protein